MLPAPKNRPFIFIFEGNVFEKGLFCSISKYSKRTAEGYSHAVIYPLNLKLRMTEMDTSYQAPNRTGFVCPSEHCPQVIGKGRTPVS